MGSYVSLSKEECVGRLAHEVHKSLTTSWEFLTSDERWGSIDALIEGVKKWDAKYTKEFNYELIFKYLTLAERDLLEASLVRLDEYTLAGYVGVFDYEDDIGSEGLVYKIFYIVTDIDKRLY